MKNRHHNSHHFPCGAASSRSAGVFYARCRAHGCRTAGKIRISAVHGQDPRPPVAAPSHLPHLKCILYGNFSRPRRTAVVCARICGYSVTVRPWSQPMRPRLFRHRPPHIVRLCARQCFFGTYLPALLSQPVMFACCRTAGKTMRPRLFRVFSFAAPNAYAALYTFCCPSCPLPHTKSFVDHKSSAAHPTLINIAAA